MQTRDVRGQKMPKNANVICESSLTLLKKLKQLLTKLIWPFPKTFRLGWSLWKIWKSVNKTLISYCLLILKASANYICLLQELNNLKPQFFLTIFTYFLVSKDIRPFSARYGIGNYSIVNNHSLFYLMYKYFT